MTKTVAEVFGTETGTLLSSAEIIGMRIDMDSREVTAKIKPEKPVHKSEIYALQRELCAKLGVKSVRLSPVYDPSLFTLDYYGDLVAEAGARGAYVNGFFVDSKADFDGETLTIELAHGGAEMLTKERCDAVLRKIVREEFGKDIDVVFTGVTEVDKISEPAPTVKTSFAPKSVEPKPKAQPQPRPAANVAGGFDSEGLPIDVSEMTLVMGRPVRQRPMKLIDVDMQSGKVTVWGDIFAVDSRETRDG